jgi:CHAT domain-containing protein
LIIVPDGALGAFPFEALVVQAGPDWGKCTLVGDRWPVTYSQSAAILALNRHLGLSRASQALFALGDPIFDKGGSRYLAYKAGQGKAGELKHAGPEKALTMAATGREWGRLEFPPLPETRQTVTDLAALFQVKPQPPQVLLDVLATETKVRQTPLAQYRYLFFGTHGFLADKLAGVQEPTLVLTQVENKSPDDGFLTFSKVLQLKLDADLVTLAACMTGVGPVMQGEGVLNFARAFQQAGSRSVMVALWNIPVEESLKFYSTFYKALKEGKTKLQALQTARQAIRAKEPHPYFWSGLILHGEG